MINRKAIGYITANYSSTYGSVLLMNLVTKHFGTSRKIKEGK